MPRADHHGRARPSQGKTLSPRPWAHCTRCSVALNKARPVSPSRTPSCQASCVSNENGASTSALNLGNSASRAAGPTAAQRPFPANAGTTEGASWLRPGRPGSGSRTSAAHAATRTSSPAHRDPASLCSPLPRRLCFRPAGPPLSNHRTRLWGRQAMAWASGMGCRSGTLGTSHPCQRCSTPLAGPSILVRPQWLSTCRCRGECPRGSVALLCGFVTSLHCVCVCVCVFVCARIPQPRHRKAFSACDRC